jgi:capsid assembly protease
MLRVDRDLVLAIEPECYRRWREILAAHPPDPALLERAHSQEAMVALAPGKKSVGDIAVIRLSGFVTQKPSLFAMLFGGTSSEMLAATVQVAMAEPSIGAVVLDVDSPGGEVFGVTEAAAMIRAARGPKPMVAVSNPFMASAAYWLASQADEVVATPSSMTGSIGIIATHVDESKALERIGLEVTEITYGRRKADESSSKPLTDEARAGIQARVDAFGQMFDADVAKGRKVSPATVRSKFGEGAIFMAQEAKAAGLVDRVGTLDEVLGQLASGRRPAARADYDHVEMAARAALAGVFSRPLKEGAPVGPRPDTE